jgi:hypothetical protein
LSAVLAAAVLLLAIPAVGATEAAAARGAARRAEQGGDVAAWREAAAEAVAADPRHAAARRSRVHALLAGESDDPGFPARAAEALEHAERAVDLDPFHAHSHWARASALLAVGRTEEAVASIAAARSRAGGIGHLHFAAGKVLLLLSLQDPSLTAAAHDALRAAGECEPKWFTESFLLLQSLGIPLAGNDAIVPDRDFAWSNWAHMLGSEGADAEAFAAVVRLHALFPSPETRAGLLAYGRKAGKEKEARRILEASPGDGGAVVPPPPGGR